MPVRLITAASKAGLIGITKSLQKSWAQGILNVNAVAPGYIKNSDDR